MTRAQRYLVVLAVAAAGCGGSSYRTPAQAVRAWSAAVNRGDDEAAAALFGSRVVFVAGDSRLVLRNRAQALMFHRALSWGGPIVRLAARGKEVDAQFSLASRPNGHCERGGRERGSVSFRVRDGKIVFLDQTGA
jgi:hypothetical protein